MNTLKRVLTVVCAIGIAFLAGCDYGVGADEDYASLVQGGLAETPAPPRIAGESKVVKSIGTSTASVPSAADPTQSSAPVDDNPATTCCPASTPQLTPCMPALPPKTDDRGHGDPLPWKSDQPAVQPE